LNLKKKDLIKGQEFKLNNICNTKYVVVIVLIINTIKILVIIAFVASIVYD